MSSSLNNQKEAADQFRAITGSTENQARFFLESAGWDVQTAVESYFENGQEVAVEGLNQRNNLNASVENSSNLADADDDDVEIIHEKLDSAAASGPKTTAAAKNPFAALVSPNQKKAQTGAASGSSSTNEKRAAAPSDKRFATLSDLKNAKKNNDSSSESDSGNESPVDPKKKSAQQPYYVGGSEHSGQQVLGPRKDNSKEVVDRLFKQAKALGATEESSTPPSSGSSGNSAFAGSGIRLGDRATGSQTVPGRDAGQQGQRPLVPVRVAMYRNGFVVGDGALRLYTDPQSQAFIKAVMKQQIPQELTTRFPGSEIDLHMENHQAEEYVPPKATMQAFTGQGYKLGGIVPTVVGAGQTGAAAVAPPTSSSSANQNASTPVVSLEIDESKPTTRLQIRLLNGLRLVGRFNTSHRISDVRSFILRQPNSAEFANINFSLSSNMTVPPTKLTDENQTIEQAGLLNASISQTKA